MNHEIKAHLAVALMVWGSMGMFGVLIWTLTIGKWMRQDREARAEGLRCLQIADEYRRMQKMTGLQGEAWTYEQAALHWDQQAADRGVRRTGAKSQPETSPSPASGNPPKPFETADTTKKTRLPRVSGE